MDESFENQDFYNENTKSLFKMILGSISEFQFFLFFTTYISRKISFISIRK